jgi:hypothetical protein
LFITDTIAQTANFYPIGSNLIAFRYTPTAEAPRGGLTLHLNCTSLEYIPHCGQPQPYAEEGRVVQDSKEATILNAAGRVATYELYLTGPDAGLYDLPEPVVLDFQDGNSLVLIPFTSTLCRLEFVLVAATFAYLC